MFHNRCQNMFFIYRTYVTFTEKVVCIKCCRMLINKTVIVKGVCYISLNREFKQIATAGATTAAVTEKVWGEYVPSVCQILQSEIQRCQEHELRSSKSLLFCFL